MSLQLRYYVCRQVTCGYFSVSAAWIGNDPSGLSGQWRCPVCGKQYAPWQMRDSLVPFNKVLVLSDCDTDLAVIDGSTLAAGSTRVVPIWWPSTSTQALHDKLKLIAAQVDCDVGTMKPEQLLTKIQSLAEAGGLTKKYFSKMSLTDQAVAEAEKSNWSSKKAMEGSPYTWDHLNKGFFGAFFREKDTPVLGQEDLARLWGYLHHAFRLGRARL